MSIEWRPVSGWEGLYEVSSDGQVHSLPRLIESWPGRFLSAPRRPLRQKRKKSGHLEVTLTLRGKRRIARVHRLVLEAFIGPSPEGLIACHNDGDPSNNRVSNLRWDTLVGNRADVFRHGTDYNVNKVACPRGHAYDARNTYKTASGHRYCRACRAASVRALRSGVEREGRRLADIGLEAAQ